MPGYQVRMGLPNEADDGSPRSCTMAASGYQSSRVRWCLFVLLMIERFNRVHHLLDWDCMPLGHR